MANKYQREKDIIDRALRETMTYGKEKIDHVIIYALCNCLGCIFDVLNNEGEDIETIDKMRAAFTMLWAILRSKRDD